MKTKNLLLLALFILPVCLVAQPVSSDQKKDDIEAQRIAFITSHVNMTPEEAQRFWPVYNQYHDELEAMRKGRATELMGARVNFSDYSDEQINQLIENEFDYRQKELDLQRKYNEEFKKVLSVKKVAMLYRAEQLFKVQLLQDLKGTAPRGTGK